MSDARLITATVLGIACILVLVIRFKLQAFLALILVSFCVGIAAGMPLLDVIESVKNGMGNTLGFVAVVVGIGAIFGKMLEISGGAEQIARTLTRRLGADKADYALALTGFIISIPVFFDVGFIILVPILYSLAHDTKKSILAFGIPLMAGMACTHAFIPPTPGPIAVAEIMDVDLGWVIIWGVIIGLPTTFIAGPVFGKYISRKIYVAPPDYMLSDVEFSDTPDEQLPHFSLVLSIIALPLLLILLNTVTEVLLSEGHLLRTALGFLGHPFVALTIAVLLALITLGTMRGLSKDELHERATEALAPAGLIILITGAGGVFKQVLIDSGVGNVLAEMLRESQLSPIIVAFLIAIAVRITQGSATVSMITAAGILAPILANMDISSAYMGLVVIAIASGATAVGHVNDSAFWLINRYFGMSVDATLRSWTVMVTLVGAVGFLLALFISMFL